MANGYKPGDYFRQFLNQLPQIYNAKQNIDLQREKFQYMKDEGIKDDVYRGKVLTANQERNKLARDQFEQRQTQNTQDEEYRTAVLDNANKTQEFNDFNQAYKAFSDAGNVEGQEMLLKSKFKDNQQMVDTINENRDIKESMKQQVYSLDALPPEQRLIQARKLLSSPYLTEDLYNNLTTITKGGKDELQFTLQELKGTEFYPEYAKLATIMNNPMPYLQYGEDPSVFLGTIEKQMGEIREKAFTGYKAGFGEYRTYDNVEDVDDNELDAYIADFGPLSTETYPSFPFQFSPEEEGQISRAGGGLGFPISDKTQAPSKKPLVVEDESGLEALVKEYEPKGSLGILEKAAKEGSVIKPVTGKIFKAISGGLSDLDSADGSMTGLTYPAVLASKPADFDQRYQKASTKFKKTLKDMYNLYLRLDPEKGAYQTKFTTGNRKMRSKIEKKLKIYKKRGQGSGSPYRFDEEIQSILDKIEF